VLCQKLHGKGIISLETGEKERKGMEERKEEEKKKGQVLLFFFLIDRYF